MGHVGVHHQGFAAAECMGGRSGLDRDLSPEAVDDDVPGRAMLPPDCCAVAELTPVVGVEISSEFANPE